MLSELSLFSGAGCGLLGTHALGLIPKLYVEIDPYCQSILRHRMDEGLIPRAPMHDDIRTYQGLGVAESFDIVTGGFPCQAHSSAARGRQVSDKDLWPEMLRVVTETLPLYVFAENVSRSAIQRAAEDLTDLGFQVDCLALSAADLGADHRRNRYWLLAYANGKGKLRECLHAEVARMSGVRGRVWDEGYPGVSGVFDGPSCRMDRRSAIGNGQVPVVAGAALLALAGVL